MLALAHYDDKSMSLYEGSSEALGSFLTEGIGGRGGLGVQTLVLKGLRLSYLEISLSTFPPTPALSWLLAYVNSGGVWGKGVPSEPWWMTPSPQCQASEEASVPSGALFISILLCFGLTWREEALLKTPAASCQTVSSYFLSLPPHHYS